MIRTAGVQAIYPRYLLLQGAKHKALVSLDFMSPHGFKNRYRWVPLCLNVLKSKLTLKFSQNPISIPVVLFYIFDSKFD